MIIWIAQQFEDNECYNIMAKTKAEVVKVLENNHCTKFESLVKVNVDTSSVFDLLNDVLGEGGGKTEYMGKVEARYMIEYKHCKYEDYRQPIFKKGEA